MPSDPVIVVKLGGSVITRKKEDARLRPKVLSRLAREIADSGAHSLFLLHGAGSFGHPGAVRWKLAQPSESASARRARGVAIVSAEVRRLHSAVLAALIDAGASPVSVPPFPVARNSGGTLERFDFGPVRASLSSGLLPVSFGDVVLDSVWGSSILSADTIALAAAKELGAKRVVFVSDVDGVLETDAKGRRRAIPTVDRNVVQNLIPTPGAPDVTGGIRAKAQTMIDIAEAGADAGLISGLRNGALSRAIRGEHVYGSWTHPPSR